MFLGIIHHPLFIQKHNVSETGFCFRLQVKPTQLGRIYRASPCLLFPEDGDGIPSPKCCGTYIRVFVRII
jgi:hypothetical protein